MSKPSKKARATATRLAAVQAVYQQIENGQGAASVVKEYQDYRLGKPVDGDEMVMPDVAFFSGIVQGVESRRGDLEEVLNANLSRPDAKIGHMDPLLQAILLCGAYELLAYHEIDAPIVISDYLDVTHAFYDQGEAKLINAVLDHVKTAFRG